MAQSVSGPYRRYNPAAWRKYPLRIVDPAHRIEFKWAEVASALPEVANIPFVTVHCGPPALLPGPPTADEFRDAVTAWLSR